MTDEAALCRWLGAQRTEPSELLTTEGKGARRREIREALERPDLDPAAREWAKREARKLGMGR